LERLVSCETKHLEGLDSWRDWTPGVTRILERLYSLRDRTLGEAGHWRERLPGKLNFPTDWNLGDTEHLEKLDSWRNWTPGVTRTLERLDP
jgi:hypothetical protein